MDLKYFFILSFFGVGGLLIFAAAEHYGVDMSNFNQEQVKEVVVDLAYKSKDKMIEISAELKKMYNDIQGKE